MQYVSRIAGDAVELTETIKILSNKGHRVVAITPSQWRKDSQYFSVIEYLAIVEVDETPASGRSKK